MSVTTDLLIRISTTGAPPGLGGLGDSFTSAAMGVTGLNSALEILEKGFAALKAVMGVFVDAANDLIQVGSTFETLGLRFETIFGGAGPAQKALDWAVEFAATTPLSLEEVADRMLKLKVYGFDPMKGSMESIGNAAFALGADFMGIATALGQMSNKGKVSQEEINQLAERGVPALRWIGEEFKLTKEQLGDIGKQGLDVQKVLDLLFRKFDTEYSGAMRKASDTWAGALSTIADSLVMFKKNLVDAGPFDYLVAKVRIVRDEFSAFVDGPGKEIAASMGKVLAASMEGTWNFLVNKLIPAAEKLALSFRESIPSLIEWYNLSLDIAGIFVGPFLAGIKEISAYIFSWLKTGEYKALAKEIEGAFFELFDSLTQGLVTVWDYAAKGWFILSTGIDNWINGIGLRIAQTMQNMLADKDVKRLFSYLGIDGGGLQNMANDLLRGSALNLAGSDVSLKENLKWTTETTGVLRGVMDMVSLQTRNISNVLDKFKINPDDPFGLGKILGGSDNAKKTVENAIIKTLASDGRQAATTQKKDVFEMPATGAFSNLGGGIVQTNSGGSGASAGSGSSSGGGSGRTKIEVEYNGTDDMVRLIIDKLTFYAKAEGTITAGV